MRVISGIRFVVLPLVLLISVSRIAAGESDKPRLPFRCFAEEFDAIFNASAPKYNRATGKLTWRLETKKATRLAKYEAYVTDGDAVEMATLDVTFSPKQAEYKAKAKVTATVDLKNVDAETVSKVFIRKRP